jgi:Rap1a immunity proteins
MSARITASLFGAALALIGTVAMAEENRKSANFMMPACRDSLRRDTSATFQQGVCTGLIEGISYMDNSQCQPDGVTIGQEIRVVVAYIDARPARMHENFRDLVVEALRAAWPCR